MKPSTTPERGPGPLDPEASPRSYESLFIAPSVAVWASVWLALFGGADTIHALLRAMPLWAVLALPLSCPVLASVLLWLRAREPRRRREPRALPVLPGPTPLPAPARAALR